MGDTDAIHSVIDSGRFDTMQAYYNLLNPSAGVPVSDSYPKTTARPLGRRLPQTWA